MIRNLRVWFQQSKGNKLADGVHFVSYDAKIDLSTPYIEDDAVQKNFEEEQRVANAYQAGSPSRDEIFARRQQQDFE